MKTINSFPVNLIAIQELGDVNLPALTDYLNIGKSTDLLGKRININDLAQLISSALGSGSILPERRYVTGSSMPAGATYSVNVINGAGQINDPYLDGKIFDLHRNGFLIAKGVTWQNDVIGGGFRGLIADDVFGSDEEFIASFQPQFSPYIPTPDAIARFTNGIVIKQGATNTITPADYRKMIIINSSFSTSSTTLPLSSDYPPNVLLCIVSDGGLQKQATLVCASSDMIYYYNRAFTSFWLGQPSQILLLPTSGGWRIVQWSESDHYTKLGVVNYGYFGGPNQWVAVANPSSDIPQSRAIYPRVWDFIQRLQAAQPAAVISGAAWPTKRQMWGTGDGSTTFNFPDLSGQFIRFSDPYGQYDIERFADSRKNLVGSFENGTTPRHQHAGLEADNTAHDSSSIQHSDPQKLLVGIDNRGRNDHGFIQGAKTGDNIGYGPDNKPDNTLLLPLINI